MTPNHQGASIEWNTRTGLIAAISAYTIWGLFPIYLKSLTSIPVSAPEILTHRILWSVPFGALILTLRKQWPEVKRALFNRKILAPLAAAACVIALNWLVYVWAVGQERLLEASLGYYINPLMYVAAGVFIMKERLRRLQLWAVIIASIGAIVLVVGGGVFPWVAFVLALSFTTYGYIRKTTNVGAMPGLFIEVLIISPVALLYLLWLKQTGASVFLNGELSTDGLLLLAGPVTVIPLLLFAIAARHLSLSALGILQYIGPTLQFLLGLYFGEQFTAYHAICFGLIWIALAIFSYDAFKHVKDPASAT